MLHSPHPFRLLTALAVIVFPSLLHAADPAPAPSAPESQPFTHPGILHNREELAFIKSQINAGTEPWKSAWNELRSSREASLKYTPDPHAKIVRGPYNNPNIGSSDFSHDAVAAYIHALQWSLTGKPEHADKAIQILNAWSSTLKIISGHDTKLLIGMTGITLCNAAEILRHTSSAWQPADQKRFESMLRELFYPPIKDFYPKANGNWDASMIQTMLAMAVFLDDRPMFDRATEYFRHGSGNGSIGHYFNSFGECQESGRDQAHTQMGLGFLGCAAEIAWKQGTDLYCELDNRLALGFEYTAKYNLGHEVPYKRFRSIDGTYDNPRISDDGRGRFSPIYDRIVYHYHHRKGLDMPFSREAAPKSRPTSRTGAHVPWGRLMFVKPPPAPGQ